MSNRVFVYYCALSGAGAGLLAWMLTAVTGVQSIESDVLYSLITGSILGLTISAALGSIDAIRNARPEQRPIQILVGGAFGFLGGMIGGALLEFLTGVTPLLRFLGWMIVGLVIGASVHSYELILGWLSGKPKELAQQKWIKGMIGGALGGVAGGLLFSLFDLVQVNSYLPRTSLALSLMILGLGIGLMVGLAQVVLKEAWIRVESGFRPGREVVLSKTETTIGRAEACDLGLFGDPSIDSVHARIERQGEAFFLTDVGSEGGTYLNNRRVAQATKLHAGDSIRVGSSVLLFGERAVVGE